MAQGNFLKNRRVENSSARQAVVMPTGSTVQRPDFPTVGAFRYNTDDNGFEFFNGTEFVGIQSVGSAIFAVDSFTGDGSTATFGPMSYEVDNTSDIIVFIGSVYQAPDSYSVLSDDITFFEAPPLNEPVSVIHNTAESS